MAMVRPLPPRVHRNGASPWQSLAAAAACSCCAPVQVFLGQGGLRSRHCGRPVCVHAWCQKEAKGGAFGPPKWEEHGGAHGGHASYREKEGAGLTVGS